MKKKARKQVLALKAGEVKVAVTWATVKSRVSMCALAYFASILGIDHEAEDPDTILMVPEAEAIRFGLLRGEPKPRAKDILYCHKLFGAWEEQRALAVKAGYDMYQWNALILRTQPRTETRPGDIFVCCVGEEHP